MFFALLGLYLLGLTGTFFHIENKLGEEQKQGYDLGWGGVWMVLMVEFWPVYWAGRAVFAATDRLQLPPGDPT